MTDVWMQYAAVLARMGAMPDALEAFKQVIRSCKPDEPIGARRRGALLKLGRFDEARAHAELAVKTSPAKRIRRWRRSRWRRRTTHEAAASGGAARPQADPTLPMPDLIRGMIAYDHGSTLRRCRS